MRKNFEPQLQLFLIPIKETIIDLKSRDASMKIAAALLGIFEDEELKGQIFAVLQKHIIKNKSNVGRSGMDLWQIFVLGVFRLGLNIALDRLVLMADDSKLLRSLLGVRGISDQYDTFKFKYQTLVDNIHLLNEPLLMELNEVIVKFGHKTFKKKDDEEAVLKTDSYVLESNVHFPTDYNLLYDSLRKASETIAKICDANINIKGWRNIKAKIKEFKSLSREVGQISSKGGKNKEERLKTVVNKYLKASNDFIAKVSLDESVLKFNSASTFTLAMMLEYYVGMVIKHIDLLERRLIKGEIIPHEEKVFSIFETYTEFIKKGKSNNRVELGKRLNITTDAYHLIIDYRLANHEADSEIVIDIAYDVLKKYKVKSWSFDKGYFSLINKELLGAEIAHLVMPKKGKCNQKEKEEEHTPQFKETRKKHSAVESNINELEHRGLDRCPDRGLEHFTNYAALGIAAYNLHKIGKKIIDLKKAEIKKEEERLLKKLKAKKAA